MKGARLKLRSFTLSEMLVVLLLTVIVVGLAFSVLNLIQGQMNSAKKTFEDSSSWNRLRQGLWRDARTYPTIIFDAKTQQLTFENGYERLQYRFTADYVIRNKDTFAIELAEKQFFLDAREVSSGRLNAMQFSSKPSEGGKRIFVYQDNTVDFYMNN